MTVRAGRDAAIASRAAPRTARPVRKMEDRKQVDPIEHATALLSTLLHCRNQANQLRACRVRDGGSGSCEREEAAFVTCSKEHVGLVVQHLVKIADAKCPSEVEAVQRCRTLRPGDDCEFEDHAALRCAALHVLASASKKRAS